MAYDCRLGASFIWILAEELLGKLRLCPLSVHNWQRGLKLGRAARNGLTRFSDNTTYPRLQILTIEEILKGKQPEYPLHRRNATFKKAPRSRPDAAKNLSLPLLPGE